MKTLAIASLVAGQLLIADAPAQAGPPDRLGPQSTQAGTFAGVRLRLPLGRVAASKPQVTLSIAPMMRSQGSDGRVGMRVGEGLGLSFTAAGPKQLSLGGRPLNAFVPQRSDIEKKNAQGVSTIGWVAIGVGAAALLYVAAFAACKETNCLNSD